MPPYYFQEQYNWYPAWNIGLHLGVDGISVAMIMLTAFVVIAGVLVSWNMNKMTNSFFFLLILLSLGAYGFFISLDLFTLFFFLEIAVIPKYLLIGIWGVAVKNTVPITRTMLWWIGAILAYTGYIFPSREPDIDMLQIAAKIFLLKHNDLFSH
jgi:NADH-quinone oxidoreductase subunit M